MRQGKGSYQERNYSTFQCDNIVFMISNYMLYSSVESINTYFNAFNTTIYSVTNYLLYITNNLIS